MSFFCPGSLSALLSGHKQSGGIRRGFFPIAVVFCSMLLSAGKKGFLKQRRFNVLVFPAQPGCLGSAVGCRQQAEGAAETCS